MLRCLFQWRTDFHRPHKMPSKSVFLPAPSASSHPSFVISWGSTNACPCICHQSCGLLQQRFRFKVDATHLQPFQSVLNAMTRLIVKKQKYDHIMASLHDELHWLPVHYRFIYKLCLFVYKSIHNVAPSYLIDQCVPVSINVVRRGLWSATN